MNQAPSTPHPPKWSLIVTVNNENVLRDNLLQSPAIDSHCQVIAKHHYECAGEAFNAAIREAEGDLLVFAHQDMFLPREWMTQLNEAIAKLDLVDPDWALAGVFGVDSGRNMRGHIYSTGLKGFLGESFKGVYEALSLDEVVLIMRRPNCLYFDEGLPGFHLYGTDICLEGMRRDRRSYIISAFCIHNSMGIRRLPQSFWDAYFYLRRKWRDRLPLHTCCTEITRFGWPFFKALTIGYLKSLFLAEQVGRRSPNPEFLYRQLLASEQIRTKVMHVNG